ncbi:hypothetical protein Tco_0101287, partial [Tanacetum coccineum]
LEEFVNEPIVSEPTVKKPVVKNSEAKVSKAKPKAVRKNNGAPIIEDWVSDNEEDDVPQANIKKKTFRPSFAKIEFVKPKQQENTARKTAKQNLSRMTHPSPKRNMVPKAVLMRYGLVSLTTARPALILLNPEQQ